MSQHRLSILSCLALLTVVPSLAQPLPTDPAVVSGQLENGLSYMVRQHSNPPGRATIWIHIHSGSLNETDAQRGLAHYLEHLAFNGSENFPPGSLVPFFESLGMTFGRDQNAFTNFEQTTYQLSLPDTKPETLRKGLTYFSDVLSKLSLLPKEIDEEREIIQEERRRSLSGRQRTMYYVLERIAPGSLYGQRITIGTEATINSVQERDFRDYYGKWYVPSNATLMIVADADPAEVIAAIKEKFADAPTKPRPTPQASGVKAYDKSFAIVTSDPEVQSESLRITRLAPPEPPTTSAAQYRTDLVASLGTRAFNRRIDAKVAAGGTSYLNADASVGNDPGILYEAELSAQPAPGKWRAALNEVSIELQRARLHGFTDREIDDVKKLMITGAERNVETEPTRLAGALIGQMNSAVSSGEPLMSAKQQLDLLTQVLPTIKREEVSARFAKEFDTKAVAFVAVLPASADVPSEDELLAAGTKALAVTPEAESEAARATQLLTELPKPGAVAEQVEHAASGVASAWLSNGVRVHHRFMDTQKNEITVSISLIGGELLETGENRGITQAAQLAWGRAATKHLTSSEIRDLMTDKKVNVRGGGMGGGRRGRGGGGGGGGPDAINLTIGGSPEDLETGFQLAYLLLTEPKIETAAYEQYAVRAKQMIEESEQNPGMLGARLSSGVPYPQDDARTQPLTIEQLGRLTEAAAQQWLDKLIATSPIEVVVVGDLPREKAFELCAKYLGALAARPRVSAQLYADLRALKRPPAPREVSRSIKTETPQAFVMSGFYGPDETSVDDVRALALATRILSTRMTKQIREQAQLVYSISAGARPGSTLPGFGQVSASSSTDPGKVAALVEKIAAMYAELAKSGVTEEELEIAKKQMANTMDEQMREPGYWMGRLSQLDFRGAKIDDILNAPAAYQAFTAEQVQAAWVKYYAPENTFVVVVKPEAAAGG